MQDASNPWITPPSLLPLTADEVQVWKMEVGSGAVRENFLAACRALLAPQELERMDRVRAQMAQDEFVIGRACLRRLLGQAIGKDSREIEIVVGENGKPRVKRPDFSLHFNVAHSRGTVLIALCRKMEVGVDVEWIDPKIEALEIARRNFAEGERRAIEEAALDMRVLEFCRIWTKKEAIVKAHGQGLTISLDSFDVSGGVENFVRLFLNGNGAEKQYYVQELPMKGRFAAALATAGSGLHVRMQQLAANLLHD